MNFVKDRAATVRGATKTLREWSAESGIRADTIAARLDRGMPAELAVALKPLTPTEGAQKATMSSEAYAKWRRENEVCGCDECEAGRRKSRPRTEAERKRRFARENEAKAAARRAREGGPRLVWAAVDE